MLAVVMYRQDAAISAAKGARRYILHRHLDHPIDLSIRGNPDDTPSEKSTIPQKPAASTHDPSGNPPWVALQKTVADSELHLRRNHSRKSKLRYRANRQSRTDCHQDSRRQYWRYRDRNATESRTRQGQHDTGRHRGHPVYRPNHRHLHYCSSRLSRETTPIRTRIIEASYRPSAEPVCRPASSVRLRFPQNHLKAENHGKSVVAVS